MSKKKTNTDAAISTWEVARKIRGDWGNVNPVTRVFKDKKKENKPKHKGRMYDYE